MTTATLATGTLTIETTARPWPTAEVFSRPAARPDGKRDAASGAGQALETRAGAAGAGLGCRETELKAAARRSGLTLKELAAKMA